MKGAARTSSPIGEVHRPVPLSEIEELAQFRRSEHAFALYDLANFPTLTDVVGWRVEGRLVGYLLIWRGDPAVPVIHWVGTLPPASVLSGLLPPRPFMAVVPPSAAKILEDARGPTLSYDVDYQERSQTQTLSAPKVVVRQLRAEDRPLLMDLARRHPDIFMAATYARIDPGLTRVVGATDESGRLVAVARTQVEIPRLWIVGGVFTEPAARRRGWGTAVTAEIIRQADQARADVGLYVRRNNTEALSVYEHLGFRPVFSRLMVDAGAGRLP